MRWLIFWLLLTLAVSAHPLGQLNADSVTTYELTPTGLQVHYSIDFGEAAAFTRLEQVDKNRDGQLDEAERAAYLQTNVAHFLETLEVEVDGQRLKLTPGPGKLEVQPQPSGLSRMHSTYDYSATWAPLVPGQRHEVKVRDGGFQGVDGWREMRFQGAQGVGLLEAPAPPRNAVEALQTEGKAAFHLGPAAVASQPTTAPPKRTSAGQDQLLGMLGAVETAPRTVLLALGLAFVLGAVHALTPGHGKTLVGAYLIGSRGTVAQAILLGVVVTITHTFSVILLGAGCLVAFQYVVPEKVIPWIGFCSGALITCMGIFLLANRDAILAHEHDHSGGHSHSHWPGAAHSHDHSHGHSHGPYAGTTDAEVGGHDHGDHQHGEAKKEKVGLMALLSLGISGGMVPCPDALVVLLSAIALNRLAFGLAILLAFSAGLACVLVLVGILMVTASKLFEKTYPSDALVRRITTVSYSFICLVGLFIAFSSIW